MLWDDLQGEKNFSGFYAYRQSKLANVLFTVELAERLKSETALFNLILSHFYLNIKVIFWPQQNYSFRCHCC